VLGAPFVSICPTRVRGLTVSTKGLAPREPYTVRLGGTPIATDRASSSGRRSTSEQFSVVNRCPLGGFICR
jgi:hypothetical protein